MSLSTLCGAFSYCSYLDKLSAGPQQNEIPISSEEARDASKDDVTRKTAAAMQKDWRSHVGPSGFLMQSLWKVV